MNIVQIGVGQCGENHARILSQLGVLSAVCDIDSQKSKECGERYSVNHYNSLEELQRSEEFDAAFVVTSTTTHADVVEELLYARKHVFVEKPMTYQPNQGQRLVKLAEKNKVILTCGYIERFNPAVNTVKKIIAEEGFGSLVMLEFHREEKAPLHIKDARIIHDTSGQDIDTANWLFGDMPYVVFARTGKIKHTSEDLSSIMLGYKDDRIAVISSNWIAPKKTSKLRAVCTDAVISSDLISQKITVEKKGKDSDYTIEVTEDDDGAKQQESLLSQIQNFLDAIKEKEQRKEHDGIVKPQEALNVIKIAEAALLSSQKGSPIYLSLK